MKDRSIRVLLISILVLGLFIVAQETWHAQNPKREMKRLMVFDLYPKTLTSLQFKGTNSVIDCVKENGLWMVGDSEDSMGRADIARVFELMVGLDSLGKGTTITARQLKLRGLDASAYGFDPPSMEIVAVDNRGRHVWEIGRTTPTGLEVYVRLVGSDEIYTIPRDVWDVIPSNPDDLRNRVLFPGEIAGVKRLEIRGSTAGFVRVAKESSNDWRIQQPIEAQADPYEVAEYIGRLQKIRVEDFIAENVSDLSAYGLQNETRQISLGSSDGSSRTLIFGDSIPSRPGLIYARRADDTSVFALKEDVLQFFSLPANPFRDARVLTLAQDEITSVRIQHGDKQLALSSTPSGAWQVTSPAVWPANPKAVYSLVDLWNKAVITDYDVSTNTVAPVWTLDFASGAAGKTNRIEVLPAGERKDGLLVRINDDPGIVQINLPLVPDSIIDPLAYKNREIWSLNRKDINKLILERTGSDRQVVECGADEPYVALESNGNAQVDTSAVDRMIKRLCNISTSEYIAYNPRNLDIYGLSNPSVELYVGLVDSNELGRVLLVGRESPEGYYSMVKGRDVVFYLDKATVDAISSDLVVKPDMAVQVPE